MRPLESHDFLVVNVNEWVNGHTLPASSMKPNLLCIWADLTPDECLQLKDKILGW